MLVAGISAGSNGWLNAAQGAGVVAGVALEISMDHCWAVVTCRYSSSEAGYGDV